MSANLARIGSALCGAAIAAGCVPGLDVPPGAEIACTSSEQCPADYTCSVGLSKCVRNGGDDTPPALVEGTLTLWVGGHQTPSPTWLRPSDELEVRFETTEALGESPVVLLLWTPIDTGGNATGELVHQVAQGTSPYVFTYTPSGSEPQKLASLSIALLDMAGNPGSASLPEAVGIDGRAPTISGVRLEVEAADGTFPSAVTYGTRVVVSFASDEPIDINSVQTDTGLSFDLARVDGSSFAYDLTLLANMSPLEGAQQLILDAVDRAGNAAPPDLGSFTIDVTDPDPPDVATDGQVVLHRAPWGTADQPTPRLRLVGLATSAEPGTTLLIFAGPDPAVDLLLAETPVDGTGAFDRELGSFDLSHLYVSARDGAGNAPDPVLVLNGRWVATYVNWDDRSHPHEIVTAPQASPFFGNRREVPLDDADYGALAALEGDDTGAMQVSAAASWSQFSVEPALARARMAWTSEPDGSVTVFGGVSDSGVRGDSWNWDHSAWSERPAPGLVPHRRFSAAMAYDDRLTRAVLFAGSEGTRLLDDTWIWNGSRWQPVSPARSPAPRYFHAMAYEAAQERVIMFGGCSDLPCTGARGNTWAFSVATGQWTQLILAIQPPARAMHTLTADPQNDRLLLFGGCTNGCSQWLGDLWEWRSGGWQSLAPSGAIATPGWPSAAFDTVRGKLGVYAAGVIWEWDAVNDWVPLVVPGPDDPDQMWRPVMTYVAATGQYLVALGGDQDHPSDEVWMADAQGWHHVSGGYQAPQARFDMAMTYEANGRAILVGGVTRPALCGTTGTSVCKDVWWWDGAGWRKRNTTPEPAPLDRSSLVWVSTIGRAVLYGGPNGVTDPAVRYYYPDSSGTHWRVMCDPSSGCSSPTGRHSSIMVYHQAEREIVIFGGCSDATCVPTRNDTWVGTANPSSFAWAQRCLAGCPAPSPRYKASAAYDEVRERVVMFGGLASPSALCSASSRVCNDTREWTGSTWAPACNGGLCSGPPGRWGHCMTYDSQRKRVLMFGGNVNDAGTWGVDETWEYDGAVWKLVPLNGPTPGNLMDCGLFYDKEHERTVLFGGRAQSPSDRTWELPSLASIRPQLRLRFDWTSAAVDATSVDGITIRAFAAGRGYTVDSDNRDGSLEGSALDGVEILMWSDAEGRWNKVIDDTAAPAPPTAPAEMSWTTLNPDQARGLIQRVDQRIDVALRPLEPSGNGPETASVYLDYVELSVEYQLP